ncbi:UNKNOWN [Stylonychia lemnae]|uniref:Uncharacterized protein n=1 Tax=Stylonychia lemnae TaxID=5949 RepID=A0A077ZZ42_STYLE|nr:UNKNOWN [Stylonychia lemnae]|eukprot:CDW73798.1 UNKNOWN [Stylonychia lemnae]
MKNLRQQHRNRNHSQRPLSSAHLSRPGSVLSQNNIAESTIANLKHNAYQSNFEPKKLTLIQRSFGTYKPSHVTNFPVRILPYREAGTGQDVRDVYINFIKKDPIRNIDMYRDNEQRRTERCTKKRNTLSSNQSQINVTQQEAPTPKEITMPKLRRPASQQHSRTKLGTDIIGHYPPEPQAVEIVIDKDQLKTGQIDEQFRGSFLNKTSYNFFSQSDKGWTEILYNDENNKSVINRSSVTHNLINHQDNIHSGKLPNNSRLVTKLLNKRKSICNFSNELQLYAMHSNKEYLSAYQNDPELFKKFNGHCAQTYDSAHRIGVRQPFIV